MNFLTHVPPLVEERRSATWCLPAPSENTIASAAAIVPSLKQKTREREEASRYESQRIAAAFGVEDWAKGQDEGEPCFHGSAHGMNVIWKLEERRGTLRSVSVGRRDKRCVLSLERDLDWGGCTWGTVWEFEPQREFHGLMARGLYCLGFEDAAIWSQLPTLSLHEQIECVVTMPREFWASMWLNL